MRLWSQALSPLFSMALGTALTKSTGDIQTLHRYKSNTVWLAWTQLVHAVLGPAANDTLEKLYYTGTDKPRVTTEDLWDDGTPGTSVPPASWILGIPAPVGPPVASDNGAGNITVTNGTWVYTFVRKYSDGWVEESAPSPASNVLTLAARQASVTVPNGAITVGDYGITHKRLYRDGGNGYFFVTEVAIGTSPATDNVATANLGDPIDTTNDLPPPDGMIGLIQLPNKCLAGHKENVVYISEAGRPHAYPLLNQYTVNAPIIGLGNVGTTILVITNSNPEVGRGVDPAAYSFKANSGSFPCTSVRSIASSELGVFWATPRGLALSDGITVSLATAEFISRKEWTEDFYPLTIHGVVHDGRYYGWFATGDLAADGTKIGSGFIVDRLEPAFLTTTGEYVYAAHAIQETDELHVVRKNPSAALVNYTYQWDADPSSPRAYEWKSKVFNTPGLENFAFAQVIGDYGAGLSPAEIADLQAQVATIKAFNDALAETDGPIGGNFDGYEIGGGAIGDDNLTLLSPLLAFIPGVIVFKYWADGDFRFEKDVSSNEPFPMPSGFLAELHEFQISGQITVSRVTIAGSPEELGQV